MKTDTYTKFMLTVIAICLVAIVLSNGNFITPAHAKPDNGYALVPVNADGSVNVDDLVNNQQQGFALVYSNAALDVGIQFDKLISLQNGRWDCPQSNRYLTLGLRVGYLYSPENVKGRFNGQIIEGAPGYAPNGPYVKLVIGFSTKLRDLKWKK